MQKFSQKAMYDAAQELKRDIGERKLERKGSSFA
jgi:hypothetical protein